MNDKRKQGRFTIQFNVNDPKQYSVAELLEQQGRRKAQFITSAVLHYINCTKAPEITQPQSLDKSLLKKLVLEILEQQNGKRPTPVEAVQQQNTQELEAGIEYPNELENIFGKDGLSAITSTLSAFQTG